MAASEVASPSCVATPSPTSTTPAPATSWAPTRSPAGVRRAPSASGGGGHGEQDAEHDEERRGADVAEPVGRARPERVQGEEPERHQAERLGRTTKVASRHPGREASGDGGEADERRGPTLDPHDGPGDREEDERSDQQAGGAEAEQDLRHRGRAEGVPGGRSVGKRGHRERRSGPEGRTGARACLAGRDGCPADLRRADLRLSDRRLADRDLPGRGAHRYGGAGPQRREQGVRLGQGLEELLRHRSAQRQAAGRAGLGGVLDLVPTVRAALRVGVAGHVSIKPQRARWRAVSKDLGSP